MVEIINFPSGKTIEQDTEDDDVKIIHQLGESLSLNVTEEESILTYTEESISSDSFWMMVCCLVFLYEKGKDFDEIRDKILQHAVLTGFPFSTSVPETEFHFDFDPDLE
jgi:hypothetical protein|tara:strand:+ start:1304 stop:1630 length:327 start_codon:yes stop_codon:yes gene_type:complete